MAKAGELFADLLTKAGVDVTNEEFKSLLGIQIEVSQEAADALQSKLMTLEAAKSKTELKNHFIGPFAQGVDQDLKELLESNGRTDLLESIKDIKGTGARMKAVVSKLAEEKKAGGNDEGSKALKEQVAKLNDELSREKSERELKIQEIQNQYEQKIVQKEVLGKFLQQPWSDVYSNEDRPVLASTKLNKFLTDNKVKAVTDESGNVQFVNIETGTPFYDSKNKLVSVDDVVKDIMTVNKYLKVAQSNEGDGTQFTPRVVIPDNGTSRPNKIQSQLEQDYLRQAQA